MQRITIIGLGLIGGSLGLALKESLSDKVEIVGCDQARRSVSQASKMGAIDRGERSLPGSVEGSALVVIATPLLAIPEVMKAIGPGLQPGCVVTDTGSTKAQVMAWASEFLPRKIDFVGGHPMAGKEGSGIEHAEAGLFEGATYCICPSPGASQRAVEMVLTLAERVGAVAYFPEPSEHDAMVAAVSHLPLIVSSALMSLVSSSESWREIRRLASSGFVGATRLASTDPYMSTGICVTNTEAIAHWIDRFIEELQGYKALLGADAEQIEDNLNLVREARENWISGKEVFSEEERTQIPNVSQQLTGMFFGEALARRSRDLISLYDPRPKKGRDDSRGKGS